MSSQSKSVLLSDAPADLAKDLLWRQSGIGFDLDLVCATITNSEEPLVFAVHGPWGSGKTSFLRMVEDSLRQRIPQNLFVSWYVASTYQAVGDVATTLTLRVLRSLRGQVGSDVTEALSDQLLRPQSDAEKKMTENYGFLQELAGKVGVLADLGVVIEGLLNGGIGSGKCKLVLIIDDLDRCSLEFIGDLLETIQRLSFVKNLFIFLAVDQVRLQNALKARFSDVMGERDPRWAREKYIQHTIDLPPLSSDDLSPFIEKLLGHKSPNQTEDTSEDLSREILLGSTEYFNVAIRNKMPRTIKACINIIRPSLVREISQHGINAEEELKKVVKARLISYLFRDFYQDWLERARNDPSSPEAQFLASVEKLCDQLFVQQPYSSDRYARFQFELDRLKVVNLLQDRELDAPEELVRLLALQPFFFAQDDMKLALGLTDQLEDLYQQSESAEQQNDVRTCIMRALQAYQLVMDHRDAFSNNYSWLIGNLALKAEKYKVVDLADRLHRLAVEMDPFWVNVVLNYVDFLASNRQNAWREALQLIANLGGNLTESELRRALKLTIKLKKRGLVPYMEDLNQFLGRGRAAEKLEERVVFIDGLVELRLLNEAIGLFRETVEPLAGSPELVEFQAAVASSFYAPNDESYESIAMDLYRQILTVQKYPAFYYVFLLTKYGYKTEAGCIWFDLYNNFRDRLWPFAIEEYAKYLVEAGEPALADRVRQLQDLDIDRPVLIRGQRSLPPQFSSQDIPNYLLAPGQPSEPYTCAREP